MHQHLVSIDQLERNDFNTLITLAKKAKTGQLNNTLKGKIIASCFFEASTRTRLSFESAIYRLGANVIGFANSNSTSLAQKGESLTDTIYMLNAYADAIVIRHPDANSAKVAASVSSIPVINAGDGDNEHPTQTLLDLYTISEKFTQIDGLNIAMVGDLKYGRTVHSLARALMHYKNITLYLIAPMDLQLPESIVALLQQNNVKVHYTESIKEVLPYIDVLYMTRLQKERFQEHEVHECHYLLTCDLLKQYAKQNLAVMHPLPRLTEICPSVDNTHYAWYFKQANNGVFMRQALLYQILGQSL